MTLNRLKLRWIHISSSWRFIKTMTVEENWINQTKLTQLNVDKVRNHFPGNYASLIPTRQASLAVYSITSTTIQ